jgi:hypothetical protein
MGETVSLTDLKSLGWSFQLGTEKVAREHIWLGSGQKLMAGLAAAWHYHIIAGRRRLEDPLPPQGRWSHPRGDGTVMYLLPCDFGLRPKLALRAPIEGDALERRAAGSSLTGQTATFLTTRKRWASISSGLIGGSSMT